MQFRRLLLSLFLLGMNLLGFAQMKQKPTWTTSFSPSNPKPGDEVELIMSCKIDKDWYIYSNDFSDKVGPIVAFLEFKKDPSYQLVGKTRPIGSHKKFDEVFEGEVSTFTGKAEFRQKVKILKANPEISVEMEYQECSTVTGQCVLHNDKLTWKIKTTGKETTSAEPNKEATVELVAPATETIQKDTLVVESSNSTAAADSSSAVEPAAEAASSTKGSFLAFLLVAFLGGLVAVVTPCVFPMLPMTVTFFTKRSDSRAQGIRRALTFGMSIIAIYSSLGFVFSLFGLGPEFGNWLSTSWVPNILFFIIFIVFAASFLGLFEITLPHQFVNSVDSKSSMGSFLGVFFMAFTLVLVSFSCTGPIVGSLLIEAVGGAFLKPMLGMAAFGAGLALPFTLFAIFPSAMQNLPKSGGWLNSVKVVLGFLELALAFKFLSIPDQTYHWGLLDREVYLAIWIVVFSLMGLYLLGKLKFSHDSDVPYISVPRLFLAIATFTFVVYLIPGLWGAPLKALSGYLPPQETLDFDLVDEREMEGQVTSHAASSETKNVRFSNLFKLPHKLNGFFDYKEAVEYAKKVNKPVFIDFTGHGCVNCREMEANVWSDPEVLKRLREDYVVVALYVDDKTELPQNEWYTSKFDGKEKKTIGKQNFDFQVSRFNANAQPYYVLIDHEGNPLVSPKAYDLNISNFVAFLDKGKENFENRKK